MFSKVQYFNVHTIKMVYSFILNLLFAMMFHKSLSRQLQEDQNSSPPPTIKYETFIFNPDLLKYHYIKIGFKEVSIGQYPEHIVSFGDLKCIHRQYGLHHYATGTIHGSKSHTYNGMAISVSDTEKICSLRDHGQLIVILLRTRIIKNNIFAGPNNETIHGLKLLLNQTTQWCYYIK